MNTLSSVNEFGSGVEAIRASVTGLADGQERRPEDLQSLRELGENREDLHKVASAFEGVFINMLLKEMRNTVDSTEGVLPVSSERRIFQEMLDERISDRMAERGALGLAEAIVRAYGRNVETTPVPSRLNREL